MIMGWCYVILPTQKLRFMKQNNSQILQFKHVFFFINKYYVPTSEWKHIMGEPLFIQKNDV
jgi:hypothetical protein